MRIQLTHGSTPRRSAVVSRFKRRVLPGSIRIPRLLRWFFTALGFFAAPITISAAVFSTSPLSVLRHHVSAAPGLYWFWITGFLLPLRSLVPAAARSLLPTALPRTPALRSHIASLSFWFWISFCCLRTCTAFSQVHLLLHHFLSPPAAFSPFLGLLTFQVPAFSGSVSFYYFSYLHFRCCVSAVPAFCALAHCVHRSFCGSPPLRTSFSPLLRSFRFLFLQVFWFAPILLLAPALVHFPFALHQHSPPPPACCLLHSAAGCAAFTACSFSGSPRAVFNIPAVRLYRLRSAACIAATGCTTSSRVFWFAWFCVFYYAAVQVRTVRVATLLRLTS